MQLSSAVRNGILIPALVLGAAHAAPAQSAADVMKKANSLYTGAKTYQATMVMDMTMGALGSMSTVTEVKSVGKTRVSTKTTSQGKPTGQMAMGAANLNIQMIDDGTTMYTYMAGQNKYMKRPHVAGAAGMSSVMPFMGDPTKLKATYKMLPATTLNGTPVYAIEVTPAAGSGMPGGNGSTTVIYIDKNTYHFKELKVKSSQPAGQGKTMNMDMTMLIKNEKFNQPIPDSVFKFTPPAGATEMQGFGGMMGGAPGGKR